MWELVAILNPSSVLFWLMQVCICYINTCETYTLSKWLEARWPRSTDTTRIYTSRSLKVTLRSPKHSLLLLLPRESFVPQTMLLIILVITRE